MDNPEKLATQGTPAIKNGQSRETSNIGYTGYQTQRHKMKVATQGTPAIKNGESRETRNTTQDGTTRATQKRTIQRN